MCEFPTYSDLGEVRVTIDVNARTLKFCEKELEDISKFHRSLFMNILRVVPKCFVFDTDEESNGYYVVPLKPSKKSGQVIVVITFILMYLRTSFRFFLGG